MTCLFASKRREDSIHFFHETRFVTFSLLTTLECQSIKSIYILKPFHFNFYHRIYRSQNTSNPSISIRLHRARGRRDNTMFSLPVTLARLIMISFITLIMLMPGQMMSHPCDVCDDKDGWLYQLEKHIYINILHSLSGHKPDINYHEPSLCWISLQLRLLWAAIFYLNSGGGRLNRWTQHWVMSHWERQAERSQLGYVF